METPPGEITVLLHDLANGSREAEEKLLPLVFRELRRRAASAIRREPSDPLLQATALVDDVYMSLARQQRVDWKSRDHFFAVAALVMKHMLIDQQGRRMKAAKRWHERAELRDDIAAPAQPAEMFLALERGVEQLSILNPRACRVLKLVRIVGMTEEEAAAAVGISVRTVKRDLPAATRWLRAYMSNGKSGEVAAS